jgi:hypothetical protein
MNPRSHFMVWQGRIANIGTPTVDGRSIDAITAVLPSPVYWIRPGPRRPDTAYETVGRLDWVWTPGNWQGPVHGRLRLDLNLLPEPYETLWPEVDLHPHHSSIIAVCLGTQPAWTNLDPVIIAA